MSVDKYPSIFSRQMEAIVYVVNTLEIHLQIKAFLGLKYQVLAFVHSLLNSTSTTNLDNIGCFSKAL